ncbi:MAG: HD domain-containing protein [Cyclobacteriaceae bacterium]|nr:HD domain-containing protein [Cyclobacteriaceae bacterium HetDA_MAG_MS6]
MITESLYHQVIADTPALKVVAAVAQQMETPTYVVGGFVRDLILGRKLKDIDIVCVGSGIQLAKTIGESIGAKPVVHKNFGTAALKIEGEEVEFVGARKESYRSNSRKPIVEDGNLADDQNRRDFTINALAISLNKDDFGQLLDPFGGMQSLEDKLIQTPLAPDETFSDDPLRIMRAIRFASQLSFDIEADTFNAIKEMKGRLEIVSQERITDELNKIILSPKPSYGFKLLFHSGVLAHVFPEMVKLQGVKVIDGKAHKDNFYHTLQVLDNVSEVTNDLWLRWAAILHDIAKPATQRFHKKAGWTFHGHEDLGARWVPRIFKQLKLPLNDKMKYVQKLVRLHLRPIALVSEKVTESAVRRLLFEAGDDIEDLMKLCKADITSKDHNRVRRYLSNFKKVEEKMIEVEEKDHLRNFKLPVTGELIMETFEIKPSRVVGDIKNEIKEAILEGTIENDYDQAFQLMLDLGQKRGLSRSGN